MQAVSWYMFNTYIRNGTPFLFTISYDMTNIHIWTLEELKNSNDIIYNFNGASNFNKHLDILYKIDKKPISKDTYQTIFNNVKKSLEYGDSYLLNLTFPTEIELSLTPEELFQVSKAPYKLKFMDKFVFFSPERFVRIENDTIITSPMKGTKLKTSEKSEQDLLNDQKEAAEHLTVVDLLRNDLNQIASDVRVDKYRYISYIKNKNNIVIQTSSDIKGKLKNNDYFSALMKLLPAGSICGAPKKKTLDLIKMNEIDDRGYYTGISGIFDGKVLDTCVNIRYIEFNNGKKFYRSGGGITIYSNFEEEYKEMIDKIYVPSI